MSSSSSILNTAAVLHGPRDIRVKDRRIGQPMLEEVQVKIVSTGLCGSDLHYYKDGRNGDFAVRSPLVLGHEAAGVVTAVGLNAKGKFTVGQRVAIEAGIYCRQCNYCTSGRYNLCKQMRFCSSAARNPHVDGTLQQYMNHPAYCLHPLPDACPYEMASIAEPLSVLIHASRRCSLGPNQKVLVCGLGAIGLLACALSKHMGAKRVVAVDIIPERVEFARKHGFADEVYCTKPSTPTPTPEPSSSSSSSSPAADSCCAHSSQPPVTPAMMSEAQIKTAQETAQMVKDTFNDPEGYDVVFECSGAEAVIQMGVFAAMAGGKLMLIGMGTRNAFLPVSTFALREIDILGSFRYANTYTEALKLLADACTPISPSSTTMKAPEISRVATLVTHRFSLQETAKAFELLSRGVDEYGSLVLKIMIGSGSS
ncbi:hypothetical protein CVT24_011127 [Panaeolus cyanescens]|uniref:Enoyl reductase (ER) domain-containing protein n=1 Tax=Panaeolus cyanescens TaxID=181874 RepID=A0A409YG84_9AGAR|nr:hypothetical protein CVT24_011127 [Panaeolus cyanescens]